MTPIELTFSEVEKEIAKTVKKFLSRRNPVMVDADEAMSTANLAFLLAYESYDESYQTKFTTWVVTKVINGLLEDFRQMVNFKTRYSDDGTKIDRALEEATPSDYGDSLNELLENLEEDPDAAYVAGLALNPPKPVKQLLKQYGSDSPTNYKMAIRWYLLKDKNWSQTRIQETFKRIKEIL